jgi:hypothetical protein
MLSVRRAMSALRYLALMSRRHRLRTALKLIVRRLHKSAVATLSVG